MFLRVYGDWTRRQSAIDTPQQFLYQQQLAAAAAQASQREQMLESALRTTRWPTKHNVAEATDDLGVEQLHQLSAFRQPIEQKPSTTALPLASGQVAEKVILEVRVVQFLSCLNNCCYLLNNFL